MKKNSHEDIFGEDFQFEIETSRKNTESRTAGLGQQSYIERLEMKIQNQAKRLSELEKYKYKNEKKAKQLNQDESFPFDKSTKTRQSNKDKEKERERYDQLYDKYNKLLDDYNELAQRKTDEASSIKNTLVSDISSSSSSNMNLENNAKLKEAYNSLKSKHKAQTEVKEKITESLRQETLKVEEQKNIISILKQTLDSEFLKSGVLTKYITPANLIDFTQLKTESDNFRKQLVLSQALVDSLKAEIEEITKDKEKTDDINKELVSSNRSLIEKMSNTEREMNCKVTKYQSEISAMKKELDLINVRLIEDSNSNVNVESTQRDLCNPRNNIEVQEALQKYHQLLDEHKSAMIKVNELRIENNKLSNRIEVLMRDEAISIKDYHDYSQLKEEHGLNSQRFSEANKTNVNLRKLIDEADKKLSENYVINKETKARMQELESELKFKNKDIKSNRGYVLNTKAALHKLYTFAMQYSQQYSSLIKQDNNALINQQFSSSVSAIITQLNSLANVYLNQIQYDQSFNANANADERNSGNSNDTDIIEVVIALLKIITNEFHSIYSKVFESNYNYKESNIKANIKEEKLKEEANSFRQDTKSLIKQMETMTAKHDQSKAKINQLKKEIEILNATIAAKENILKDTKNNSSLMNARMAFMTNDKDRLENLIQLTLKFISNKQLVKLIQEYITVNDDLFQLGNDRIKVEEKLTAMQDGYDKMIGEDKEWERERERRKEGNDLINTINREQNALKELLYELHNKIEDNLSRLNGIKANIQQFQYSQCSHLKSNENSNVNSSAKMHMTMSDPHMFSTIRQETSNMGRKELINHYGKIKMNDNGSQLTDFEDSDMESYRGGFGNGNRKNIINKTINVCGSRTMRASNNLTYEMNKKIM